MNWCTEYQCWCADLDGVVDPEDQKMECQVMSCEDCRDCIEIKEREQNDR